MDQETVSALAAELTIAWLSNPNIRATAGETAAFFKAAHGAVSGVAADTPTPIEEVEAKRVPAVSVRASLARQPEFLVSMIDGKPYKTLKRHLAGYGMTPDDYRQEFGLKPDYPMVATAYSERRSAMAKASGLGRKPSVEA